jgi:hypothetical protein
MLSCASSSAAKSLASCASLRRALPRRVGSCVSGFSDKVLHDRYAIDDNGMPMFGTSLNGLGLKQSLVVSLGEDVRLATLAAFEATWDKSAEFWPPA